MSNVFCLVCRTRDRLHSKALCERCTRHLPARIRHPLDTYYQHRRGYVAEWTEVLAAARQWHLFDTGEMHG